MADQTQSASAEMISAMEQMPGGRLIQWLHSKLDEEQTYQACQYILSSALKQMSLVLPEEEKDNLEALSQSGDYTSLFNRYSDIINPEIHDEAAVYLGRFTDGWNLGFEVMVQKYNLNLEDA